MNYFEYESNQSVAIEKWNTSQFDLTDIVLYLSDRHIIWGIKIYSLFCKEEIKVLLNYFSCNFEQIKKDLCITGDYVERGGNIYSKTFNPKRNMKIKEPKNLNLRAMRVYDKILIDIEKILKNFREF